MTSAFGVEPQIAETGVYTSDGTPVLIISMRNSPRVPPAITGNGYRLLALSRDGGMSWGDAWQAKQLVEPIRGCDGSLVYHPGTGKLYLSHPDPKLELFRTRLKVWSSSNLGATWEEHATVWDQAAGYSALTVMSPTGSGPADLGLFYDRNNHTMIVFEAQSVSFTTLTP